MVWIILNHAMCHKRFHANDDMWSVQVYHGLAAAARGIVAQHGVRGLYRGLGITMIEIVPYSALQFGLYDSLNSAYNKFRVRCLAA